MYIHIYNKAGDEMASYAYGRYSITIKDTGIIFVYEVDKPTKSKTFVAAFNNDQWSTVEVTDFE